MEMGDASHCGTITFLIKEGERWSLRLYLFPVLLVCSTAWCRFPLSLLPLALKKGVGFPPCFSSSAIFVLPPPCPPHPKEEKLHPEEGDVRGEPTGC